MATTDHAHRRYQRRSTLVLGMLVFLLVSGCSQGLLPCPVAGQVLVNGRAARGVYVVFTAADTTLGEQPPQAFRTETNGSFAGQLPGPREYLLTLFWPEVAVEGPEVIEGEDRFRGKYSNRKKPLRQVAIHREDNLLPPIHLTLP